MAARLVRDEEVAGSNPAIPTLKGIGGYRDGESAILLGRAFTHRLTPFLASIAMLLAGQFLQIAMGPSSRIQGTYTTRSGLALLSPDSAYYLQSGATLASIAETTWAHWTYLLLVRLGHLTGDAANTIVLLQGSAVVLVGTLLLGGVRRVAGPTAGWIALASFSVNPFIAQWFRFVQTETLFFALVLTLVLLLSGIVPVAVARLVPVGPAAFLLAMLAAGMRPNGILVLIAVVGLLAWRALSRDRAMLVVLALAIATPFVLIGMLSSTGQPAEASLTSQLRSGVVVEGTDDVRITTGMPPAEASEDESIGAAARYAVSHPAAVLRLGAMRVGVEVIQVRPHYTSNVNLVAGAAIGLFLLAAGIGWRCAEGRPLRGPVAAIAIPILLLVGATFATPEGRYGWGALVTLVPMVGIGAARVQHAVRRPTPRGTIDLSA